MTVVEEHSIANDERPMKRRRVRNGEAANDLVLSAYVEGNDCLFPRTLDK